MIISIKENWAHATEKHSAYVTGRVNNAIDHYSSRLRVDRNIVNFLTDLRMNISSGNLEALVRTIPEYLRVIRELEGLDSQREFRRLIALPTRSKTEVNDIGEKSVTVFFKRKHSPELGKVYESLFRMEQFCSGDKEEVVWLYEYLVDEVLAPRKKPKGFDFTRDRLDPYIEEYPARTLADQRTLEFLRLHCGNICLADYSELRSSVECFLEIKESFSNEAACRIFVDNLRRIFNYDEFVGRNESGWDAYKLCQMSRTRTCPYCNQAYAFTIIRATGGGCRPTLDHFLPKGQFPHLALSLNNLVPCCYTCNSNLKGKKDFYKDRHLNPLCDEVALKFVIDLKPFTVADLMSNFELLKNGCRLSVEYDETNVELTNSVQTFMIEERYQPHLQEAIEFASLRYGLDSGRLSEISAILDGRTEAQLLRFDRSRYRETLLGKMYADLFDAFAPNPI